jgi:hypothetical protein
MKLPFFFVTAVGIYSPHLSAHGFSATEQPPKKNHRMFKPPNVKLSGWATITEKL